MTWPEKESIRNGVASMLKVNLPVQEGERVLVMTDPPRLDQWRDLDTNTLRLMLERSILARMVADFAAELMPGAEITFLAYPAVKRHGAEVDPQSADRMRAADAIIAITNYSLTHTMAAQEACEAGARMASMPGFLPEMFEGPMMADYGRVAEESRRMAQLLTEAKTAVVTTPFGTDLTLSLEGRSGDVDIGLITAGRIDNLPAGEAFIAPLEGKAEGRVTVTPGGHASLEEQMTIHFEAGQVSDIDGGGRFGQELRSLLELPEPNRHGARRNLAELGIGTNPKARSVESLLEAEKIKGTVHIAIGDNSHIGGIVSADLHQDFVLWDPDLRLDGRLVIQGGKWLA